MSVQRVVVTNEWVALSRPVSLTAPKLVDSCLILPLALYKEGKNMPTEQSKLML